MLIIGGGGAGCAAALTAVEHGAHVILATKLRLGDSNTVMARRYTGCRRRG
ncbi:FAD-binding protein [Pseudomonas sp. PCH446]